MDGTTTIDEQTATLVSKGKRSYDEAYGQMLRLTEFGYDVSFDSDEIPREWPDWLAPTDAKCYVTLQLDYDEHRTLENTAASPKELERQAGVLDRTTPGVRRLPTDTEPPDMTGPSPQDELDFHSDHNSVWATDPDTGEAVWRQDIGGNAAVKTVFTPDTAYAVEATTLYAFDAETGERLWTTGVDGQIWDFTVENGTVLFGTGGNTIYAVDAATGEIRWTRTVGDTIKTAPVVVDGTAIVAVRNGEVYALNLDTGESVWETVITGGLGIAISAETTYIKAGEYVHALDLDTGTLRWRYHCNNVINSIDAVSDGRVYLSTRGDDCVLEATGSTQLPLRGVIERLEDDETRVRIRLGDDEDDAADESLRMPASALPYYAVFEQAHLEVFMSVDTKYEAVYDETQRESSSITGFSASVTNHDGEFVTFDLQSVEDEGEGELRLHATRLPDDLQHEGASGSVSVYVEFDEDATPREAIPELYRGD